MTGRDCRFLRGGGRHCLLGNRRSALRLPGIFSLHSADSGTNRNACLIFRDRLGQNQLRPQAKSGGQTGAAIDNGYRNRTAGALAIAAYIEDKLGRSQVLAIDQHEIEAIGIQLLRGGGAIERALTGDRHLFEHGCDSADGLIIGRE